jgi:hypothetical protein
MPGVHHSHSSFSAVRFAFAVGVQPDSVGAPRRPTTAPITPEDADTTAAARSGSDAKRPGAAGRVRDLLGVQPGEHRRAGTCQCPDLNRPLRPIAHRPVSRGVRYQTDRGSRRDFRLKNPKGSSYPGFCQ